MADIVQQFVVKSAPAKIFEAMATPSGLSLWWTMNAAGDPRLGAEFSLFFGPEFDWRARVTRYEPNSAFELEMTNAHTDWLGTRVGFELEP